MGYSFDIAGGQIDGARDYQEDAFLITHLGEKAGGGSLVIVADGMGGHAAGNVASNLAVQAFNRHISSNYPSDDVPGTLHAGVLKANAAIAETVRETAALKGMGCTFVCAIVADKYLRWVSVGDSNLYLLRDGQLRKKNADHSYGGFLDRMAAEGKVVEPEPGFSRNMLMSALTGEDIADIDCPETPLELQPGDRIIIASDGLDTLSDATVAFLSGSAPAAREYVDALLQGVADEKLPRQDNTTVVVIDVRDPAGMPAESPVEEILLADDSEDRTEPKAAAGASAPPPAPAAEAAGARAGGKGGLIAGVVVAVLALGGIAGWFLFAGKQAQAPEAVTEPASPDTGSPPVAEPEEPPPEAPAEPSPPPAAPATEPAPAPAAAPVPAPEPEKPAPTGTFRDALQGGGTGPEMVWIPAGSFTMGSSQMTADPDEKPTRQVSVRRFAMATHEITLAEYERFAKATGRKVPDNLYLDKATHPVFFVTWDDALYYARWLSQQTGHKYRLPTEAEWEYAARGGSADAYWWGRQPGRGNAHCFGCESGFDPRKPTRIGSFKPNRYGLYDTAGNIAEWVQDCYHPSYTDAPTDGGVWEGGDCAVRVIRGGSFASAPKSIRPSKRDRAKSDAGNDSIGFRVAREP